MPELTKRMNAGWVLMTSCIRADGGQVYLLERGKNTCMIDLDPTGHGYVYTDTNTRRI